MKYKSVAVYSPVENVALKKGKLWNIIYKTIIILILVIPLIYTLIRYMSAPQHLWTKTEYIHIPLSSLPLGAAKFVSYNGEPVIVINSHGGIKALSALCTLTDSLLQWDNQREELVSSQGARFDLNGNVKGGLAPRPLARFKVMIVENTIIISRSMISF